MGFKWVSYQDLNGKEFFGESFGESLDIALNKTKSLLWLKNHEKYTQQLNN